MTCSCCGDFAIARVGEIQLCEGCLNEFEDTFGAGRNSASQWQSTAGPEPFSPAPRLSPSIPSMASPGAVPGDRPNAGAGEISRGVRSPLSCADTPELLEERND